jgi:hypothetical protein
MAPRTLWNIILKIFGIYIFIQILYSLPQVFAELVFFKRQFDSQSSLQTICLMLFTLSVFLFMLIAFIFKTDWLIDKLGLLKSFDEEKIELNIHRSTVLKIVIIFSGIMLFVEGLPTLLKEAFTYLQDINTQNDFRQSPGSGWIVYQLAKVSISLFMMSGSRVIVNFIERKRKDKAKVVEE